jgi:NitT/TauT family transport system permease protein
MNTSAAYPAPARWSGWLVIAGLLSIWEALVRLGAVSPMLAPAPTVIGGAMAAMLGDGLLLPHLRATVIRLTVGIGLGASVGAALGLAMGWLPLLRRAIDPLVAALHPIPKVAIFPLLIVVLGIGEESKIFAVALTAFFPTLINAMAGVREIAPTHIELARNYGASPFALVRRVLLPGALPMLLTGLRIATSVGFLAAISVEMVASRDGLGALLVNSWQMFRVERVYATIFVIALLGMFNTSLIRRLRHRLVPWTAVDGER